MFLAGDTYSFSVPPGVGPKHLIGRVSASGASSLVRYRVRGGSGGGLFGVDAATGQVRTRVEQEALDRER